jgi:hypothetical protein
MLYYYLSSKSSALSTKRQSYNFIPLSLLTLRRNIVKEIFANEQEKATLLTQLNLLGAKEVRVEFQGGGDDGQVDGVYMLDNNEAYIDVPDDMIAWTTLAYGDQEAESKPTKLIDALEDLCSRALDNTGLDWYNNGGGQGNLTINFKENPPSIRLNVGINHTTTEDYEYDLNDDEEDE